MSMDHDTVIRIRESFKRLLPVTDELDTVYERLFEAHPHLRPLFAEDIQLHAKSLMQTLGAIVDNLQKFDAILAAVTELARRPQDQFLIDEHYLVAGDSLVWILEQGLGHVLTSDVWKAWIAALDPLSDAIIAAAKEPCPQRCCAGVPR